MNDKIIIINASIGTVTIITKMVSMTDIDSALDKYCEENSISLNNIEWMHFHNPIEIK